MALESGPAGVEVAVESGCVRTALAGKTALPARALPIGLLPAIARVLLPAVVGPPIDVAVVAGIKIAARALPDCGPPLAICS